MVNFLSKTITHTIAHARKHTSTIPAIIPAPRVLSSEELLGNDSGMGTLVVFTASDVAFFKAGAS